MIRGETITTTVRGFPVPIDDIAQLYIIFRTSTKTVLEKTLEDCTVSDETVQFKLSQEESLLLRKGPVWRSVILMLKDGSRIESKPDAFDCGQTAKDEVL